MSTRVGVVVFPGTNCERDVAWAVEDLGAKAVMVFHRSPELPDVDVVVVPGGFAHGDYLRPGAMARFSPVMRAVSDFAEAGGPVVGICNGFQVLCETGLLPGALRKNAGLRVLCQPVDLRVETTATPLTARAVEGSVLRIPINHFEGNYAADPEVIAELEGEGRVVLRYCRPDGTVDESDPDSNPNGATRAIAGICSPGRNVVGLMPHPERASSPLLGSSDGRVLLESLLAVGATAFSTRGLASSRRRDAVEQGHHGHHRSAARPIPLR
jgi:phosphoribosylformylglycinamidine synthase